MARDKYSNLGGGAMQRSVFCIVVLWLGVVVSSASAQPGPRLGRFWELMALRSDKVHAELKVTDEQQQKLTGILDAAQQQREGLESLSQEERQAKMAEIMDKTMSDVGGVLNEEQMARLGQIGLQLRGVLLAAEMPRCGRNSD